MIYKSSSPLSPQVSVLIDGVAVDYSSINGAELHLEENKHDLLVLKSAGVPSRYLLDYLDAPIVFSVDSGPGRTQVFVGYVANIEPSHRNTQGFVNHSPFQEVDINCIGASYYMKGKKSTRWNPPTLRNVVNTFSKRYGFSADFPRDTYTPNGLVQNAESDWELLVKTVEQYGYKVTVHGTHIHIWDINKAVGRLASYHDLLTISNVVGAQPCMILEFKGVFGSLSSTGGASSTSTSFLDNQGNSLMVSSRDARGVYTLGKQLDSPFDDFISTNAQSYQEAERAVLRAEKDDMPFEATAKITAGAGVTPGGIVNVTNYGTEFDGLWYVKSVVHNIYQNHYLTDLKLSKNGLSDSTVVTPPVSRLKTPPESTLINKAWVAKTRRVNEYV